MSADRSDRGRAAEYTTLRGELGSLRNRSLAIFGGALVVSGVAVSRWLEFVHASKDVQAHMVALFFAYVVVVAMALTYKFYEDGFRIAAYVEVFHENGVLGWKRRDRQIRDFMQRRGAVHRRSLANLLEPQLLAWLYLPLVVTAGLLILASPLTAVRTWNLAPAAFALGVGTYLFLELGFFLDRRHDRWRWWWGEYGRLEGTEPDSKAQTPASFESRHDSATAVMALLLLEVVLLFLLGFGLQPALAR